jgi:hypothetical protein
VNKSKVIARYVLDKCYPVIHKRTLHNHRIAIAQTIFMKFGGTVKYGPFKGLDLILDSSDLSPDFPSMFFGTYEQELLDELVKIPAPYENFINLGAGDGYYPIGALKSGIFKNAIAYEENESRRIQMKRLAQQNSCLDSLEIRGFADENCFSEYTSDFLSKCVILSDIEGGEFELFSEENLVKLSKSIVLIEIHDFLIQDGQLKLEDLLNRASKYFELRKLTTTKRDLSQYAELKSFTDIDRWFVVVEGRGPLMTWLLMNPKSSPKSPF